MSERHFHFPPFRLDADDERLWRGTEPIALRPKTYSVLTYLVAHPGRLVSQAELIEAVWQHPHLSDGLLRGYIRELRAALGDDAATPRFIETVSGRGYRFLAPVAAADLPLAQPRLRPEPPTWFVGREGELAWLEACLEKARQGKRQVALLAGEAGIGKTTLAEAFAARSARVPGLRLTHGQCVEGVGPVQAYLPVIEALMRLAQRADGREVVASLRHRAPTWLAQMPSLVEAAEWPDLLRRVFGATPDRMMHELATALEELSARQALVLRLEDLHWSDPPTVQLLAMLARRSEEARLLILGTYRPELIVGGHPLRAIVQELGGHGRCAERQIPALTSSEVSRYLTARFAPADATGLIDTWVRPLFERTEGNPLFLSATVDDLLDRGVLGPDVVHWPSPQDVAARAGWPLPESLRQLIDAQLERLSPTHLAVLEAAGVVGAAFSMPLVAAMLAIDVATVAAHCEDLLRHHHLVADPPYGGPERRLAERYSLRHALYREVLYRRLSPGARRRLHARCGWETARLLAGRQRAAAAGLARHFELGGEGAEAVRYLLQAAREALMHASPGAALEHLVRALALLRSLPRTDERDAQELGLEALRGAALLLTLGYTATATRDAFERAYTLSGEGQDNPQLFGAVFGIFRYALVGGDLARAQALADRLTALADHQTATPHRSTAQLAAGAVRFHRGDFSSALVHFEAAIAAYDPTLQGRLVLERGEDDAVIALGYAAWTLHVLGAPDRALIRSDEALAHARTLAHPHSLFQAHVAYAYFLMLYRKHDRAREEADVAIHLAQEHDYSSPWLAMAIFIRGWALVLDGEPGEGLARMREGLAAMEATGTRLWLGFCRGRLAEACLRAGQVDAGLAAVTAALAISEETGEASFLAELHRLRGELLLARGGADPAERAAAEASLLRAAEIGQGRGARLFELRAATSLARHHAGQGDPSGARRRLREMVASFPEGFDCPDLSESRAVLGSIGSSSP
jgi:predicted ATPase/DNA-binding winged helix-turn-helix (wHTH) protein